jgi:hypothetical protein
MGGTPLGEIRYVYKILVGKPEGKRPLGRPRHKWEDNIKLDLKEIRYGVVSSDLRQALTPMNTAKIFGFN